MNHHHVIRALSVLPVLCMLLAGCVTSELLMQPPEEDLELGKQVSQQVEAEMGIIDDPEIKPYIESVGKRLTAQIADRQFDYNFNVADQPESNAFAAPGGYVYVSRGLLAAVNSEDELANVVGHEIIHVRRRHTAKQMAKQRVPGLLTLPGEVVGRVVSRDVGNLLNMPAYLVGATWLSSYSRQHELEADELGIRLAAGAGYDPQSMAAILERLEQEDSLRSGEKRRAGFFDSHPTTPKRVNEISRDAEKITWKSSPGIAGSHAEFLGHLEGLVVGINPAKGIFRKKQFLHPDLDLFMEFPKDWKTTNTAQAVAAIAPKKDGLIILGIEGDGNDPEQAASEFLRELRKEYGKIIPFESRAVKVGDWPAYLMTFTDSSGREPMHMHFLWIASRGLMYRMVGVGPERYREVMKKTALSLRPLTAKERASIKETRLRIASAKKGESLGELSKRTGNSWELKTTALMNGLPLEKPLEQGQLIKITVSQKYRGKKR